MSSEDLTKILVEGFPHGFPLLNKYKTDSSLKIVWDAYVLYRNEIQKIKIIDQETVTKLVELMNNYRRSVVNILEHRSNNAQESLRSTILEEFFMHLFKDLITQMFEDFKELPASLVLGKANSYVSLTFAPYSFKEIFTEPNAYIHTKDQDFVLGCAVKLIIQTSKAQTVPENTPVTVIPIVAIECKTYIERNMLDSCAATARRLKAAMPYCKYIVASEYMKLGNSQPELTDIDEVYILCKSTNSQREMLMRQGKPPHVIDADLIWDIFSKVKIHLNSIWWDPQNALSRGKIINR